MAKNNGYTIPKDERHAYKMLVQRANRRLKANLKYIESNNITNAHTQRMLAFEYVDQDTWAGKKQPLSRTIQFESEKEYKHYKRHLERWGQETEKGQRFNRHPTELKQSYKSAIIKALNEVKDSHSITLPNAEIPKEIIQALDSLSITEISNFFNGHDPVEDIVISQFGSKEFDGVTDAKGFIDVVMSRIASIKQVYK